MERREPIVLIGTAATAIIAVLEAVGEDLLPAGVATELVTIVQAIVAVAGILLARRSVFSPETHTREVNEALHTTPPEVREV